ncbi:hypothetical protein CPB86DRAFT_774836 [Serendipita vermifera]|nr:hypothetical protein CPB86DRAFT_774836 [Serendipita vermifera]
MRQSNVCSPAQNQACLLITSRLYDRRGLDCTAPLPLFNSLAHLVHLTATSPKIREILTRDGGLERLVRILRDFVANPPPPQDYGLFYGLLPPIPTGNPDTRPFDRDAAQRFSLAFQCIVNVGRAFWRRG